MHERFERSRSLSIAFVLSAAIGLVACAVEPDPSVIVVTRASIATGERPSPPPSTAPAWQPAPLPDVWSTARRQRATRAWYRAEFDLAEPPSELWAVWLPRLETNGAVWINGVAVGSGGRMASPLARSRNRPLLFPVPSKLLRAGGNMVDVELAVEPSSFGLLEPFLVGPERLLRPPHERKLFLQITLVQIEAVAAIAIALLVGLVYWRRCDSADPAEPRRRSASAHRYAAAASALWSVGILDAFVRDAPLPAHAWVWLQGTAQYASILCIMIAFHRVLGVDRRRLERAAITVNGVASLSLALAPPVHAVSILLAWGFVPFVTATYEVWIVARAGRMQDPLLGRRMIVPGMLGVTFAVHDLASGLAGRPLLGVWLVPHLGLVAVPLLGWGVLLDLVNGLREFQRLNRELEDRVREKHAELIRNHARLADLECERAVHRERERLMRDMHDGMGGHLVSTLAMVERGGAAPHAIADALRDALNDLRLVIDSLEPSEGELLPGLALIRSRLEERLARDGIQFDWQVEDIPVLEGVGPGHVLAALRIVQEALTNIIKHSEAALVRVRTGAEERGGRAGVAIEIADDGVGIDPARKRGRGIANMERRAADLGGALDIESGAAGTVVRLWLPVIA